MVLEEDLNKNSDDVDQYDNMDPMHATAFVNDIYDFLREKEATRIIPYDYLSRHTNITNQMRRVMVDWLSEVHQFFHLMNETFFLCIDILDRYLSCTSMNVEKQNLQLICVTSLLIATKYEELFSLTCGHLVYISCNSCTKEDIIALEQQILKSIDFYVTQPSPLHFLRRLSKVAGSDCLVHNLCKFIIEMSVMEVKMLKYLPSHIAASSVYIARNMLQIQPTWTSNLERYSKLKVSDFTNCIMDLNNILIESKTWTQKTIRKKYETKQSRGVSLIPPVQITM